MIIRCRYNELEGRKIMLSDTTSVYLCIFLISRFTNRAIFYSINSQSTNVFHFWIFSLGLKRISWLQFLLSAPFEKPGLVGFRIFFFGGAKKNSKSEFFCSKNFENDLNFGGFDQSWTNWFWFELEPWISSTY